MNNVRRDFMNSLRKADVRRFGRLLGLLLSLAVVGFLYALVLTRGGILP